MRQSPLYVLNKLVEFAPFGSKLIKYDSDNSGYNFHVLDKYS